MLSPESGLGTPRRLSESGAGGAGGVGEIAELRAALARRGPSADLLFRLGVAQQRAGELPAAIESYRHCLRLSPALAEVHNNLGTALDAAGRFGEALPCFERALALKPDYVRALTNLGKGLQRLERSAEAIRVLERTLELSPDYVPALVNLGFALTDAGRPDAALAPLRRALARDPDFAAAHHGLARALLGAGDTTAGFASLERALALEPRLTDAHLLRGRALLQSGQSAQAIACLERAARAAPDCADVHDNLAFALYEAGLLEAALASANRALALDPQHWRAELHRAQALAQLRRFAEARLSLERVLARRPGESEALAEKLNCCLKVCDWAGVEAALTAIHGLEAGTGAVHPFVLMAVSDDPALLLRSARGAAASAAQGRAPLPAPARHSHQRIRVAYLSADYCVHATSFLLAELLELHERGQFEVYGVSFGPDDESPVRRRMSAACDVFADVREKSDREIALWLREHEIDIAVDLKGYTAFGRSAILAYRPAPIQVNYLGYPGTLGGSFADYIIADAFLIPEAERAHYQEQVVRLPNSYQVNDRRRVTAVPGPTRAEAGLPADAFVFCCFNNNWKITAPVFAVWMRLLAAVEGSVLWLFEDSEAAAANLRAAAVERGVAAERLVFATRIPNDVHLARHRLADLFLDTAPVNAHTTASDALWSGLPLITCAGRAFAGRVSGSLLRAVGLAELITGSLAEYEQLALSLARDPARLAALRTRLLEKRAELPLFDTPLFSRHLEAAYRHMWVTHREGRPPASFSVGTDLAIAADHAGA